MHTPSAAGQVTLGAINMEADDPRALASFWAEVTGGTPAPAGDHVYLAPPGPGGFAMFFQPLTASRPARSTVHLDLTVPWGSRVATAERLLTCGATHLWDVLEEYQHVRWTTLADPEGNPFCIAEHPPTSAHQRGDDAHRSTQLTTTRGAGRFRGRRGLNTG